MNITKGKIVKAQKVVIYGPEGIGKSTFASHFPNPLFSDTEGSTTHLDVSRFDKPTSWPMLIQQAQYVKQNKPCATYVIDTADWAEKLCKEYIIGQNQNAKSIEDYGYGKGYTMLAEEWGRFLNLLQEIVDVGVNVVINAHAIMRKFEQPSELGSYDRWELKLEKKTAPMTKEWADAVLFSTYEIYVENIDGKGAVKGKNKASGGTRIMYTSHHPAWDAKNRWTIQDKIPFEFNQIAKYIPTELLASDNALQSKTSPSIEMIVENNQIVTKEVIEPIKPKGDFSYFSKSLQDLIYSNNVTERELIEYITVMKGHFPRGTELKNLPREYTDGALVANWAKVLDEIKELRNKSRLDINADDLTF